MPVVIVAIVFGSFLVLMKMILDHKKQNQLPPRVDEGSSMRLSELNEHIRATVQEAVEPLVARIDELESAQLMAASEKILISEKAGAEKQDA